MFLILKVLLEECVYPLPDFGRGQSRTFVGAYLHPILGGGPERLVERNLTPSWADSQDVNGGVDLIPILGGFPERWWGVSHTSVFGRDPKT